jgi:preprotein translocase subunit YajC
MMRFFIADAWAQADGAGGGGLFSLLPLVVIFGLFYFLLIRPQQKKKKEHQAIVTAMQVGDEVTTNGGLLGKVTDLDDNFVTIDVAQGVSIKSVKVRVQRHAIALMVPKGTFKELAGGGGKISKGSGKKSKASASNVSGQIADTPSDNAIEDATFEDPYTEDATLEAKEPEVAKKETQETIKDVAVGEDEDAIIQSEEEPSGQIAEPQAGHSADGDQSKIFKINGVEWKQWIKNLLLPFK